MILSNGLKMDCQDKFLYDEHGSQICCDYCPKGKYVDKDCSSTNNSSTVCKDCESGHYLAAKNFLKKCNLCKECHDTNNMIILGECLPDKDRECACKPGYYCSDKGCEHCLPAKRCPPGLGAKVKASPRQNAVCEPCQHGTYNNVTDSHSSCLSHTRCEDNGQVQKSPGTDRSDVVCTYACPWMLPAGLWAGLVLTSILIILLYVIYWKAKRRSHMTDFCAVHVNVPEKRENCVSYVKCALSNGHCQESCEGKDDKLLEIPSPRYSAEDECHFRTPVMASDQLGLSNHTNENDSFHTSSFLRTVSEPQEDEWGET